MGILVQKSTEEYEKERLEAKEPLLHYDEHVIKRHRIKYSVPQLVRLGLLPYYALEQYEQQKKLEAEAEAKEEAEASAENTETSEAEPVVQEKKNHTFWEDDDGDRENLSDDEYAKFLEDNAIQLNSTDDMIANLLMEQGE